MEKYDNICMRSNNIIISISNENFLNSYFSTIAKRLEPKGWGTRFPYVMNEFYNGELFKEEVEKALEEILVIKEELQKVPKWRKVWNYSKEEKYVKEDDVGDKKAKNCYEYYINEGKKPITDIIIKIFREALKSNTGAYIGTFFGCTGYETMMERAEKIQKKLKDYSIELTSDQVKILRIPYRKISKTENKDICEINYAQLYSRCIDAKTKEEIIKVIEIATEEIRQMGKLKNLDIVNDK